MRYIISRPTDPISLHLVAQEDRIHGDLLPILIPDGTRFCFAKIFFGLKRLLETAARPSFFFVCDDDAYVHPTRLAQDLSPLVQHDREVLYGQVAFAAGWSDRKSRHYGYGEFNENALRYY